MDKNTAQALCEVIQEAYANDHVKKVFTPFALVEEMLYDVNLHGDILVVSDLGFLPIMAERNVDFSRVTFIAHTPEQFALATEAGCAKVFQVGYNSPIKEMERHLVGMKFDVVVGNPPYQNNNRINDGTARPLWPDFLKLAIEVGERILFIVPQSWSSYEINHPGTGAARIRTLLSAGILRADFTIGHYFNVGSTFSIIDFTQASTSKCYIKNNAEPYFEINPNVPWIPTAGGKLTVSILEKTLWNTSPKLNIANNGREIPGFRNKTNGVVDVKMPGYYPLANTSAQYTKGCFLWSPEKHPLQDCKKVIFSGSGYPKPFYDNGKYGLSQHAKAILVENECEADAIINLLNSDIIKFCCSTVPGWGAIESRLIVILNKIPCELPILDTEEINYISQILA